MPEFHQQMARALPRLSRKKSKNSTHEALKTQIPKWICYCSSWTIFLQREKILKCSTIRTRFLNKIFFSFFFKHILESWSRRRRRRRQLLLAGSEEENKDFTLKRNWKGGGEKGARRFSYFSSLTSQQQQNFITWPDSISRESWRRRRKRRTKTKMFYLVRFLLFFIGWKNVRGQSLIVVPLVVHLQISVALG